MTLRHVIGRSGLRAAMAMTVFALVVLLPGCAGHSYKCGTGIADHCYGIVTWKGSATGLSMELTAVALQSGDIFVDDEAWLIDVHGPGEVIKNVSWVEAGELNEGFGTYYFWAENQGPNSFMKHFFGPVQQSDINSAQWIAYDIHQDATPTTWNISLTRAGTGEVLYTAQSTGNTMKPNKIETGQELAGSANAQAPLAFFAQNSVYHGAQKSFQPTDGDVYADRPPFAGWWGVSNPAQSGDGGILFTDCC